MSPCPVLNPPPSSLSGFRRSFPTAERRQILDRDQGCQLQLFGCSGEADEADHIIGHADASAAGWSLEQIDDPSNGQAVCRSCHQLKATHDSSVVALANREQRENDRSRRIPVCRTDLERGGGVGTLPYPRGGTERPSVSGSRRVWALAGYEAARRKLTYGHPTTSGSLAPEVCSVGTSFDRRGLKRWIEALVCARYRRRTCCSALGHRAARRWPRSG